MRQEVPRVAVAVTASDVHLCHSPPPCRAGEKDWYAAMKRSLDALKAVRDRVSPLGSSFGGVPVIIAGDIFDRWNPPHELVNFALDHLPDCYAVPGQHDLPHHSYVDIKKSAYWTLVKAGKITNLDPGRCEEVGQLRLHGFPWGHPLKPLNATAALSLDVAVIHHLIFTKDTGYPDAPEGSRAAILRSQLKGFDIAVFGDNHKGFLLAKKEGLPAVVNNGAFMRRRSDEEYYQPCVSVIYSDGSVERVPLDVEECFERVESKASCKSRDFRDFLGKLSGLSEVGGDFREEIKRELDRRESPERVRRAVWQSVEGEP